MYFEIHGKSERKNVALQFRQESVAGFKWLDTEMDANEKYVVN